MIIDLLHISILYHHIVIQSFHCGLVTPELLPGSMLINCLSLGVHSNEIGLAHFCIKWIQGPLQYPSLMLWSRSYEICLWNYPIALKWDRCLSNLKSVTAVELGNSLIWGYKKYWDKTPYRILKKGSLCFQTGAGAMPIGSYGHDTSTCRTQGST